MENDSPERTFGSSGESEPQDAIGARERLVLTAVVESYIASGDPVGSQSIARQQNREGMSAATIRNVMAELSESGYLEQPHTSAGRIPTARAFRYYVEQLLRRSPSQHQGLTQPAQEKIDETFAGVANATDFFARTSHVLALLSGGVGLALTAAGEKELLEHVHFLRLGHSRVLAVLVTTAGMVRDRLLTLNHDLSAADLETAANYLNRDFHGWAPEQIRLELARRMELERSEYDRIQGSLAELWAKCAMERMPDRSSDGAKDNTVERGFQDTSIFVEGVANLMVAEVDREHLRQILMALEEKQRVVDLLNAYVDSRNPSVRVIVGLGETMPELRDLVLVAAPARRGQEHLGTVAVIGPTRMQYANTIGTVTYVADLFGRWAAHS